MKDKLEILLSCMYQTDDIIKRSNIKCNATVVNQCDKDERRIISNEGIGGTCKINWFQQQPAQGIWVQMYFLQT